MWILFFNSDYNSVLKQTIVIDVCVHFIYFQN